MAERHPTRGVAAAGPRHRSAVLGCLRERRVVDLLRARRRRQLRARADADHVHDRRPDLRGDRRDLRRGDRDVPEAGGSSSFARHAFNELVSFVAGWGQMLNYIITVAISAFFVPHYLAVFWSPLGEGPGDIIGGIVLIAALAALNIKGTKESARLNLDPRDRRPRHPGGPGGDRDRARPRPADAGRQRPPRRRAVVGRLRARDRGRDDRLHRDRDDLEHGRGGQGRGADGAERGRPGGPRGARPIRAAADRRAVGDAGDPGRGRHYTTKLGTKFADDPVLGIVENLGLSSGLTDVLRYYVGVLAAVILTIATNAGLIGLSRLTYSMGHYRQLPERAAADPSEVPHALHRDHRLLRGRGADDPAGQARLPGDDVLVRRDAVVHGRARLGRPIAPAIPGSRAAVEAAAERTDPRAPSCR